MPTLIITHGLSRTGTTWSFNVCRKLLSQAQLPYSSAFAFNPPVSFARSDAIFLLKTHSLWRPNILHALLAADAARLVVSVRDPGQTALSLLRVQNRPLSDESISSALRDMLNQYLRMRDIVAKCATYITIDESEIQTNGNGLVERINDYCNFGVNEVTDITSSMSKESDQQSISELAKTRGWLGSFWEWDEESQWHANHVSSISYDYAWSAENQELISAMQVVIDEIISNQRPKFYTLQRPADRILVDLGDYLS